MKKKGQRKEDDAPVVPRNQMARLKKLFTIDGGNSNKVDHARLN